MTKRQMRGQRVLTSSINLIRKHPSLLLFAIFSSFINTVFFGLALFPILNHEFNRLTHTNPSVLSYSWFYVITILFFYLRNLVNGIFDTASLVATTYVTEDQPHPISLAWKTVKKRFGAILSWHTIMAFTGGFQLTLCAFQRKKNQRPRTNGACFRYSALVAQCLTIYTGCNYSSALQQAGAAITSQWGRPPMRLGFAMGHLYLKYTVICLLPIGLNILIYPHLNLILYITAGISTVMLSAMIIISKTIHSIIHQGLYQYTINQVVHQPFDEETAPLSFKQI